MHKILPVAAAAVAALFSAHAAAQTTVSTTAPLPFVLTIYGNLDLGARFDSGATGAGNEKSALRFDDGQWTTSRFGIRAEKTLNPQLTALAEIQGTLVADGSGQGTASAYSFDRLSVVGLRHKDWGYANFGNEYTPMHRHVIKYNAASYDGFAGANNSSGLIRIATRRANQFNYRSPKFAGFGADLQVAKGETTIKADAYPVGNATALGLAYDRGPLSAGVAYERQRAAIGTRDFSSKSIGASYDLGAVKLYAITGTKTGGAAATAADFDLRASTVGIKAPLWQGTIFASVGRVDSRGIANADASTWGVNYLYPLGQNVNAYVMYGELANKNGATRVLKGGSGGSGLFTSANVNTGGSHTIRSLGFGVNMYF